MSWTKKQLVAKAYASLGVASYIFDLQPEELQDACNDLDAMIASWKSLNISYTMSENPDLADINADSGLPTYAIQAVYLNLALFLALPLGRDVPPSLIIAASKAKSELVKNAVNQPTDRQFPSTLPLGAGVKGVENQYFPLPIDTLDSGPEGQIDLIN